jgi:hypothetical protein
MSRDSICDFVLSITTSNVAWWDKNVKSILQEGVRKKEIIDFTGKVWRSVFPSGC